MEKICRGPVLLASGLGKSSFTGWELVSVARREWGDPLVQNVAQETA